jgi:hypothetical protein
MKSNKIIHLSTILLVLLVSYTQPNAQIVRFVVNVDKVQVTEEESSFAVGGSELVQIAGRTVRNNEDSSSRCLPIASKENVSVLIRTSMNANTGGVEQPVESRYINNGNGCPDNADRLLEVSSPVKGGQATFHLNELQISKRSLPGIKKEVVSYLAFPGYRKPGMQMKDGNVQKGDTDAGVEITIEIEFL